MKKMFSWPEYDALRKRLYDPSRWQSMGEESQSGWESISAQAAILALAGLILIIIGSNMVRKRKNAGIGFAVLGTGLGVEALCLFPTNIHVHLLPHSHWIWVLPILAAWWFATFVTSRFRFDDWVPTVVFVIELGFRFLFDTETQFAWALMGLIWLVFVSGAVMNWLQERPGPRNLFLSLGWYLLAVLA